MIKKKPKFLRRRWYSYGKLGKKRKKKQVWRRPAGRDNKMRDKRRGYLASVSIGYGTDKTLRGKIQGKTPVHVYNVNDLKKLNKNEIAIFGKIGKRKMIEMAKYADEHKIEVENLNLKRFLKKLNKIKKPEVVEKKEKMEKKK
jgi:ribosomal protein L32E